jgi:hypothetical protein
MEQQKSAPETVLETLESMDVWAKGLSGRLSK